VYKYFKNLYRRQSFYPGFFGLFTNAFFFARFELCKAMRKFAPRLKGSLLDVGCGSKPYQELLDVEQYIGLEIDSVTNRLKGVANCYYDGKKFPFESSLFDSILCNQVLEHVFNPNEFIEEISRVLKPSGKLLLSVPFVWDEHEQPYDYARYSSFALVEILEANGFKVLGHIKTCSDARIIFQMINAYLYKIIANRSVVSQLILTATIIAFFNIAGIIFGKILPENPDLYLDNVVLAEKV
jgi:SAM-dependent methyltransferase